MRPIPPEVWAAFERRMDEARVPTPERSDLCVYLHACKARSSRDSAFRRRAPYAPDSEGASVNLAFTFPIEPASSGARSIGYGG